MKWGANITWLSIFTLWLIFLSGILAPFVGSPGIIQQIRLYNLLDSKKEAISKLQTDIDRLENESNELEKSRVVQHREIRKVLGYAAEDEIIFDFSSSERLSL